MSQTTPIPPLYRAGQGRPDSDIADAVSITGWIAIICAAAAAVIGIVQWLGP